MRDVLKRKNPYLFRAKNYVAAGDLVRDLLNAHLSSQEETLFGQFLEQAAIFVCAQSFGGKKSSAEGIDLEFERDGCKYLVSVKSGPNWGNAGQIDKMKLNFRKAKKILGTNAAKTNVIAVNGCCYGTENQPDKGEYLKLCGEKFWALVSGEAALYLDLIEPLGHRAKEKNDAFLDEYGRVQNKFTAAFIQNFCAADGAIDWDALVRFNSQAKV